MSKLPKKATVIIDEISLLNYKAEKPSLLFSVGGKPKISTQKLGPYVFKAWLSAHARNQNLEKKLKHLNKKYIKSQKQLSDAELLLEEKDKRIKELETTVFVDKLYMDESWNQKCVDIVEHVFLGKDPSKDSRNIMLRRLESRIRDEIEQQLRHQICEEIRKTGDYRIGLYKDGSKSYMIRVQDLDQIEQGESKCQKN
ncbi:MAG: hypothetical protein IJ542_02635 [Clostridia bacterium]|nr:hypothetical protein [Clostridia bacterium]